MEALKQIQVYVSLQDKLILASLFPFSSLNGERSAGDYLDLEISLILLMGEPLWFSTGPECTSYNAAHKDSVVMHYREKKKKC